MVLQVILYSVTVYNAILIISYCIITYKLTGRAVGGEGAAWGRAICFCPGRGWIGAPGG